MKKWILICAVIGVIYFLFCKRYYPTSETCILFSSNIVGKEEYNKIHKNINDSVNNWIKNRLYHVRFLTGEQEGWRLDTVLCFNNQKDKMIGALLDQDIFYKKGVLDDIHWFYGVKIKAKWYFFLGPDLTLIRSNYQPNSSVPLSFAKLHELAVKHIFRGYLYQNLFDKIVRPNHWNINEEFFSDLTSVAWGYCQTQECWDKRYLEIIKENWSKTDTTHYDKDK